MAIEVQCEKCSQSLRAGPKLVGKKARCPKCGNAVLIKAPEAGSDSETAGTDSTSAASGWFVRADDDEFGPVEKTELDEWAIEGRLDADCHVRCETWGADEWKSAGEVYPKLATKDDVAKSPPKSDDTPTGDSDNDRDDDSDEFTLSPLDGTSDDDASDDEGKSEKKADAPADDNPFAAMETADAGGVDFSSLEDLGGGKTSGMRVVGGEDEPQPAIDDDDIQVAQPDVLDGVLEDVVKTTPVKKKTAGVRLSSATTGGSSGVLSALADTADAMLSSVQAAAFLTMAGSGLAVLVGLFWVVRSAPTGLWAFTIAGASLIVVGVLAGIAAKNLLTHFHRIDAFAENGGSKELARQMNSAKKFWSSAMIAVIAALVLSVISLLAFAFVPVEHKGQPGDKKEARSMMNASKLV